MNMKKRCPMYLCFMVLATILLFGGCSIFDNTDYVPVVQNGYLGEYTDVTVKDLLWNFHSNLYEEEIWDGGTTDDGKEIVEVIYKDTSGTGSMDDARIQFTMLDEQCFEVTAFVDPMMPTEEATDVLATLNFLYFSYYAEKHPESVGNIEKERTFIQQLEKISASAVNYGAASDYKGDRSKICELAGDTPMELGVPQLLDASGYLDLSFYYQEDEPAEDVLEEPGIGGFTDSGKYASVEEFLEDPDVKSQLEEMMSSLDDDTIIDVSGSGDTLIYTFIFTDDVDIASTRAAMKEEMNDPVFTSVFEDIAASLSDAIEVINPTVIVSYWTWDGIEIYSQEYYPSY